MNDQVAVVSSMKPSNEKRPKFQNLLGATTFKAKLCPAGDLLPIYTDISFVQPNHCSKDCLNKCFQVVPSWPSQEILHVQNMFKSDQLHTSKQVLFEMYKAEVTEPHISQSNFYPLPEPCHVKMS